MEKNNLDILKGIARGIVGVFGDRCEVAIHDFSDMTKSIVHIEGNVTNRTTGGTLTGPMLRMLNEFGNEVSDKIAYKITTDDGKILKCASIFIRDKKGRLEGCLAINFNISDFMFFSQAFSDLTFVNTPDNSSGETLVDFKKKPNESMESIIDTTVRQQRKPPAMMNKAEKKEVVQALEKAGVFMVKGSIEYLARVFGASKYTVYNYLKEVRGS